MQTQSITKVPFNALRLSPRNVRKTEASEQGLRELAASIAAEGLLQQLVVTEHKNGKGLHYEVEAGGRRLAAMGLLVKNGTLKKSAEIPVTIIPIEQAVGASLAENTAREQMHIADEVVAISALANEGKTVEDIASRFGVTPTVVKRRLKLANVAPVFLDELRAGKLSLESLMALALTDDHEAQIAMWKALPQWARNDPRAIRAAFTKDELNLKEDRLAKFVGLKAYEKAGGKVRQDLFANDGACYLQDVALVQQLAAQRLEAKAEEIRAAEGWAWGLPMLSFDHSESSAYGQVTPGKREPTKAEAKDLKKLLDEKKKLDAKDEMTDEENDRFEELYDLIADAEDALREFGPKQKAKAGVVVTLSYDGKLDIRRGLIKPEDVKAAKKAKKTAQKGKRGDDEAPERDYSADLTRSLSANFTAALQAQLVTKPHVALALTVHALLKDSRYSGGQLLQLRADTTNLVSYTPDTERAIAAKALADASDAVEKQVPEEESLAFLLEQTEETLIGFLAVLVAPAVNAVTAEGSLDEDAKRAARAAGLDVSQWWKPSAENFFKRVSKDQVVAAAKEIAPGPVAEEIAKLPRKGDMVARLESELKDSTWLPPLLRI